MTIKEKCNLTDVEHYAFMSLKISKQWSAWEVVAYPLTARLLLVFGVYYGIKSNVAALAFMCLIGLTAFSLAHAYKQLKYKKIYETMAEKIDAYVNR